MSKKDLEKEINILEHEIFIERVLTRAMDKKTITLRDHFAGLAMQTYVVKCTWHREEMCKEAYKWADAMIAEREKRDG